MEPFLHLLSSATPVDAPPNLLAAIQQQIAVERAAQRRWLRTAAAAAILIWGVQGYVLAKAGWGADVRAEQVASLIPQSDNSLYYNE